MLTLEQALIIKAMEEAGEVIQRGSKLMRFGLDYIEDGQPHTNAEIFAEEVNDLLFVFGLLAKQGVLRLSVPVCSEHNEAKAAKFAYFLALSRERGMLEGEAREAQS